MPQVLLWFGLKAASVADECANGSMVKDDGALAKGVCSWAEL